MKAPAPLNLTAMASAWDDPVAFARELNRYYSQLAESGHHAPTHHWTERETA